MDPLAGVQGANPASPAGVARTRAVELSVVIPCRDVAAVLPAQLASLGRQSWDDARGAWEVIVADNGSTDETRAAAHAAASAVPDLHVVDASARTGRHHACNAGAHAARGEALVFLDADDEIGPGYLDAMADALREHAAVAARLDHSLDPQWMDGVGSTVQTDGLQSAFGFLPHGAGASLGFRRSAFDAIGGFREHMTYCEDVDICWRAQLAGHDLTFVPGAVVRYRSRPDASSMLRQHRNYGRAQALLYREFRASGMPRRRAAAVRDDWLAIARGAVRATSNGERARWARRTGRCLGRLEGSARFGIWYP